MNDSLVWACLLCTLIGLVPIWLSTRRKDSDTRRVKDSKRSLSEWSSELAATTNLKEVMRTLPLEDQVEVAEVLLRENTHSTPLLLERMHQIILSGSREIQRRALKLVESSSIPAVARISLAERILETSQDDDVKVAVLASLVGLLKEELPEKHPVLLESLVAALAFRVSDSSERVRGVAQDIFARDKTLTTALSDIDRRLALKLSSTQGPPLSALKAFIIQHADALPHANTTLCRLDYRLYVV